MAVSSYARPESLVATDWLVTRLDDPDVVILDASWHMPATKRDAIAEFRARHIPGARFFNIDTIANTTVKLPHMAPDEETFARMVGALGIDNHHHAVVYDANGGAGAAMRAWWMFRLFGHTRVSVLAGGFGKWLAETRRVESGETTQSHAAVFYARIDPRLIRSIEDVRMNIGSGHEQLIDVRSAGRFAGTEPEPRAGLRGGHIPGSTNLPFPVLLDPANHMVPRSAKDIARAIDQAGIDRNRPIVASCGSGVTACVLAFALHLIGDEAAVYDGSWTEWGGRADVPIET